MTRSFTQTENSAFYGENSEEKAGAVQKENKNKRLAGKRKTLL